MAKPPKDYYIFKKYIDEEKNSIGDYLYFFIRLPLNLIEWILRDLPGPAGMLLRRLYYSILLKRVGRNVLIAEGVYFQGNNIELDDWCYIDKFCVFTSISKIRIGKRVHIGIGTIVHAGLDSEITIDDNTGVAARCNLYSSSNAYARDKRMSGPMAKSNQVHTKYGKIKIEKDCFIGIGSTILPNVKIGYASIVSAGALIKKDLAEKSIFDEKGEFIGQRIFDENNLMDK
tara:strand:- start:1901 stop:2590 length:690 start_codon:yes stop_codon:yes gene_type:complete